MKTKLIILGSGSSFGVPRIDGFWGKCQKENRKNHRTRCSAIILKGLNSILIDTSPDLRNQLILNNIKNLSSVIYTHEHADHTSGLFELRPFFYKNKKKINIYGNLKTMNNLKKRYTEIATRRVKLAIIIQKIANELSISISNEELTNGLLEYASQYPGQEKEIFA